MPGSTRLTARSSSTATRTRTTSSTTIALYLYGRSFFLEDQPIDAAHREAVDYFLGQARRYWLDLANRQSQAHLAVALKRFGDRDTPQAIMRSIKERSVTDEELGMFWRELELSWWWYRAPIETQAMMIEAFDEVMNDAQAVEECKVWLLKQKQTQDWKTTKATADAVYGLLLRGTDLLASDALVEVTLADTVVKPQAVEAGTGFYEQRFAGPEVKPALGAITVKKTDPGVAWGSVHWQYLEDMTKVTPYEGTPLKLKKTLYVKELTDKGPVLQAGGRPDQGGRRTGGADRAADRPRHGVRPPEGPPRQRHGTGQRAVAVQVPGRPVLLRKHAGRGQPLLHRLPAQGRVRLRVLRPRPAPRPIPDRHGPDPVHVRPGVQQPFGEHRTDGSMTNRRRSVGRW